MIGQTISHYRILTQLGQGGMGVVFMAEDTRLRRTVAIKMLPPGFRSDAIRRERFIREATSASALDHPNICTIHEIDESDGALFLVMAYYEGESLRQVIDRGPVPFERALDIAIQVTDGLAKAHDHGIIHRDIKPNNLMITREGLVKLVDFGLATTTSDETALTAAGDAAGTLSYMSPEQISGVGIDQRVDLWAVGVVLYEMLSGWPPFRGNSAAAVLHAILNAVPEKIAGLPGGMAEDTERLLGVALAKDPALRFESATQFRGALMALRAGRGLDAMVKDVTAVTGSRLTSVIVLPFENRSPDPEDEYFSDGLTEELIHAMAQVENLRVISRSTAFEFKSGPRNLRAIGQQTRVTNALEGSVRRSGTRVRIAAQLVTMLDGAILWAQSYDRELTDVFGVQDEIATAIVTALRGKLGAPKPAAAAKPAPRNNAFHLYLRGRFQWNKKNPEAFAKAMAYFQEALAADPDYAPTYAAIADCYEMLALFGLMAPREAWPQAEAHARHAIELDPNLAEAHISTGAIRAFYEWDWPGAEASFRRALELEPNSADAEVSYALIAAMLGRFEDALRHIRRAHTLDPLAPATNAYEAAILVYAGHYDEAMAKCREAQELDPDFVETYFALAMAHQMKAELGEAIAALEKARQLAGPNAPLAGALGSLYAQAGREPEARSLLASLEQQAQAVYVPGYARAIIHAALGEMDTAFAGMMKSLEERDALICYAKVAPLFAPLRSDARYEGLLKRLRLTGELHGTHTHG